MRIRGALLGLCLLTACGGDEGHSPLPDPADLARMEKKLERHPCVGDLGLWERTYRFKRNPGMFWSDRTDFAVIEFHFRRAGTISLVAGSKTVLPDDSENWPDSPAVEAFSGGYNVKSGTLSVDRCRPVRR